MPIGARLKVSHCSRSASSGTAVSSHDSQFAWRPTISIVFRRSPAVDDIPAHRKNRCADDSLVRCGCRFAAKRCQSEPSDVRTRAERMAGEQPAQASPLAFPLARSPPAAPAAAAHACKDQLAQGLTPPHFASPRPVFFFFAGPRPAGCARGGAVRAAVRTPGRAAARQSCCQRRRGVGKGWVLPRLAGELSRCSARHALPAPRRPPPSLCHPLQLTPRPWRRGHRCCRARCCPRARLP